MSPAGPTSDLAGPGLPGLGRALESPAFPLGRDLHPDDGPFSLAGDMVARLDTAGGGITLRAGGDDVITGLRIHGATFDQGFATPVGVERRFRSDLGTVVERVVVPRTGAIAFVQWTGPVDLSLLLPRGPGPEPRWRILDRGLVVEGGRRVILAFSEPAALRLEARPHGVEVRTSFAPGSAGVRLAVGVVGAEPEGRLLRRMGRIHVAARARRADARRVLHEGLVVETPEPELDEAFRWDALRLAGLVGDEEGPEAVACSTSSALAVGQVGRVRASLDALADVAPTGGASSAEHSAALIRLATRYLAWTGDRSALRRHWDRIRAHVDGWLWDGDPPPALRGMAVVAEEVGDPELAERIRAATGRPVAGGTGPERPAELADAVCAMVRGLLDVDPDAPRGRVTLRPRLPAAWERLVVRNLPVGAAALDLSYERDGRRHRFELRQTRGGAPLQVVFEPELPGGRPDGMRVDDRPARLDPAPAEGRWRVPVQLVLDHERRLAVDMGDGDD